MSHPKI